VTIARISGTPLARKPNKDGVPVLLRNPGQGERDSGVNVKTVPG
jgi:hypothetical protein